MNALRGHVDVLQSRLTALKAALDEQPDRTAEVEFQYDRVLRAADKLARFVKEQNQ